MKYEEMSDFEINKLVVSYLPLCLVKKSSTTSESAVLAHDLINQYEFDPCNNWADAGPIIAENKINIEWRDSLKVLPMARGTGGCDSYQADKNVLRAAMICFLKMKGAENE